MRRSPEAAAIASSVILACYPRAVRSLFMMMDLHPAHLLDVRNRTADTLLAELACDIPTNNELVLGEEALREELASFPVESGTDAWFPIIDKDRCCECEKCHDFCLFGVYALRDGRVKVAQPQQCKNNCPACARVCPSGAIIFPKYDKSPINGGDGREEQITAVNADTLYADVFRMRLEQRRASVSLLKKGRL
jgi:NAD-dependent dihydropyrimidine dehydrogenase PreA subunit